MDEAQLVVFTAALIGSGCLRMDGDGGGKVILTVPDSEKDGLRQLMDCRHQELIVTVAVRKPMTAPSPD